MDKKEFQRQLINRYVNNEATDEELEAFFHLLESDALDSELLDYLGQEAGLVPAAVPKIKKRWPRMAAAASILIAVSVGIYAIRHTHHNQQIAQVQAHDIAPARNQATLTLANGQKIILTKSLNGQLAKQGSTAISINGGNALRYAQNGDHTALQYNTLTTARGEQSPYVLVLSDGTKVWLNAASSITYPVAFNGKDRKVSITGEAYFEVEHNAAKPFFVSVKGQTIQDIGTSFDINAYDDEPGINTTLLSGSVKVNTTILQPGQVAVIKNNSVSVKAVDTEGAVAWKNGYFLFDGDDLESIMRKVSRWYNVSIVYEYEGAKTKTFGGTISRYKNVSSVLRKLEKTGAAHFKLEGQQITVTR